MRFDCPIADTDLRTWPSRPASNARPDIFSRRGPVQASGLSPKKISKTTPTKPAAPWKPPAPEVLHEPALPHRRKQRERGNLGWEQGFFCQAAALTTPLTYNCSAKPAGVHSQKGLRPLPLLLFK